MTIGYLNPGYSMEKWYWVDVGFACYGIVYADDKRCITSAAPIAKWMIGKTLEDIKPYLLSKKAKVKELTPFNMNLYNTIMDKLEAAGLSDRQIMEAMRKKTLTDEDVTALREMSKRRTEIILDHIPPDKLEDYKNLVDFSLDSLNEE
jgi:hypothetical protein